MQQKNNTNHLNLVQSLLKRAGWLPGGRSVIWDLNLECYPNLPPNIERIFNEFGDLRIPSLSKGLETIPRDVEIGPLDENFVKMAEAFGFRYGAKFFPIGTADHGRILLFADTNERIFILAEDVFGKISNSFEEALIVLLLGLKLDIEEQSIYDPNQ